MTLSQNKVAVANWMKRTTVFSNDRGPQVSKKTKQAQYQYDYDDVLSFQQLFH